MRGSEQVEKNANEVGPTKEVVASANSDRTIDQVRDLLFGGAQRSIESSLAGLRDEMQTSVKQIQAEFAKELAAVHAKLQELERESDDQRLASQRNIGAAISELGAKISGLGSGRTGS